MQGAFEVSVPTAGVGLIPAHDRPSRTRSFVDTFDHVRSEEFHCIRQLRERRVADGVGGTPFSLAFSGGGTRAAAFQGGVLWRLAQEGVLRDVEYVAAVSGGAYVASAFASHCLAAKPPAEGDVRGWYLDAVGRMLSRMQHNAGGFVRDAWAKASRHGDRAGAGSIPRIFDLPMLLLMVLLTVLMNPAMFFMCVLVPFTMGVEIFFGAALRAAFCADQKDMLSVLIRWSSTRSLVYFGCWLVVVSLFIFFLRKCCTYFQLVRTPEGKWSAPHSYLGLYALQALVNRLVLGIVFLVVFIFLILFLEVSLYTLASDTAQLKGYFCMTYIHGLRGAIEESAPFHNGTICTNVYRGSPWYTEPVIWEKYLTNGTDFPRPAHVDRKFPVGVLTVFVMLLLGSMACSVIFLPILGRAFFVKVLLVAGPVMLLALITMFVQYCVFGPITANTMGSLHFTHEAWDEFVSVCLGVATCFLPFYREIRASFHKYYTRTLQQNFFRRGMDQYFSKIASSPYCPYLILTATTSDYQSPGEKETISEIFFTALHFGGPRTGYAKQPTRRSLAKCTAISGAGCLDAISFSMSDALSMRFWLEVLNLTWGDFIEFGQKSTAQGCPCMPTVQSPILDKFRRMGLCNASSPLWLVVFILLNFSWHFLRNADQDCPYVTMTYSAAITIIAIMLAASFFSFLPCCDLIQCLNMSPLIRHIHQATKFFYVGDKPPGMLYVTDGGIKDCTGITQLLRRRRARILLVLAAADPDDELMVFRTVMGEVTKEKVASFYDPRDPRQGVEQLLDEFKMDRDMPFLHVGLYYWATEHEESATGKLVIVKNRLPRVLEEQPVQAPLTVEEVCAGNGSTAASRRDLGRDERAAWGSITTDQLGPFGCCDCCHTNGWNCGPKFPHGTFTNYLYLSPQWFNSLARLGYASAGRAIWEVTREGVGESWEQHIRERPPDSSFRSASAR